MTEIIRLSSETETDAVARARAVVSDGGIVAFPTETVYGIGTRGDDPAAIDRLYALKERDGRKPLARYVVDAHDVERDLGAVSEEAGKLMRAFWPGPLTLVVELPDGSTHGYRCSSHPFVPAMVAGDIPFVGTSANLSGEPPIGTAEGITEAIGDGVDLVVDAGRRLAALASTVVRVSTDGAYEVLRVGDVPEELVREELTRRILFVCTGNTCRSPLAEVLMTARLDASSAACPLRAHSAGLAAGIGSPASENARIVARERGLDLGAHRSRPVTPDLLASMDHVYTMTAAHREVIVSHSPELSPRVTVLGIDEDVSDPFGGSLEEYRACAESIDRWLDQIMETT